MSKRKKLPDEGVIRARALRSAAKRVVKSWPEGPLTCAYQCGKPGCADCEQVYMLQRVAAWLEDLADEVGRE